MSKYISKFRQNGKKKNGNGNEKDGVVFWSAAHGTKNLCNNMIHTTQEHYI